MIIDMQAREEWTRTPVPAVFTVGILELMGSWLQVANVQPAQIVLLADVLPC